MKGPIIRSYSAFSPNSMALRVRNSCEVYIALITTSTEDVIKILRLCVDGGVKAPIEVLTENQQKMEMIYFLFLMVSHVVRSTDGRNDVDQRARVFNINLNTIC